MLGHLDKGGTFEVKQEPVARGFWELTTLHVEMRGKVLFFKTIGVQQNYSASGGCAAFRLLQSGKAAWLTSLYACNGSGD